MPANKTMRITGGSLVRRRFLIPSEVDENLVRPTPDRVREALFSIIKAHLQGARILDIFAGSGAHGFEAISRGASQVCFLEKNPRIAHVIRENIAHLDLISQCTVIEVDALQFISSSSPEQKFDVIFCDPPYLLTLSQDFFAKLTSYLAKDGILVFRCHKKEEPNLSEEWQIIRERIYGGTKVFIIGKRQPGDENDEKTQP